MKKIILICIIAFAWMGVKAQMGIGTTNPHPNAMLEVYSEDKGIIIPRVDFNNLPTNLPAGFLVYVTNNAPDGNEAFYFNTGTEWRKMIIGVEAIPPLSATSGLVPQITIPEAGPGQAGFISMDDWNAFNEKLDELGGTLSGPLVFSPSSSTEAGLNIPHGVPPASPVDGDIWTTSAGIYAQINGTTVGPFGTGNGTVTEVNTTGPLTGGPITTTGTVGITKADATTDGYVDATDWNTFNNKISSLTVNAPINNSGTAKDPVLNVTAASGTQGGYLSAADYNSLHLTPGSIPFYNGTGLTQNNSNLYWNNTNLNMGIGTSNPNSSSILDIQSTTDGILIPRMTAAQRAAISSPATGLLVFQTDGDQGFWFYDGTTWRQMAFIGPNGGITRSYGYLANYNLTNIATTTVYTKYNFSSATGSSESAQSYDVTASLTNGRITVSTPGVYLISANISLTNASGSIRGLWAVYQNGTRELPLTVGNNLGNGAPDVVTSTISGVAITTTANEYFELYHNDNLSGKKFDVTAITLNVVKLN